MNSLTLRFLKNMLLDALIKVSFTSGGYLVGTWEEKDKTNIFS